MPARRTWIRIAAVAALAGGVGAVAAEVVHYESHDQRRMRALRHAATAIIDCGVHPYAIDITPGTDEPGLLSRQALDCGELDLGPGAVVDRYATPADTRRAFATEARKHDPATQCTTATERFVLFFFATDDLPVAELRDRERANDRRFCRAVGASAPTFGHNLRQG